jgi:nicotinamide phosphoribosyltransferase
MKINPFLLTDFYKTHHVFQYPPKTQFVYSNLTPRKSRLPGVNEMVFFGLQYFLKAYLVECFNDNFFNRPKADVMAEYRRRIKTSLGGELPSYAHLEKLHDLGYLPLKIKALPEGSRVPMRVPCLTIMNTLEDFYWLTNFIESLLSAIIWQPCTSATIAFEYRKLLNRYAIETGMAKEFVQWQGHDFSFRGMSSLETAILSGMGHLLSFTGTDTIPAIDGLEKYYGADCEKELIGGSVPATEHSVMCSGEKDGELATFKRLVTEVYPNGIVSIVSDTWDLWKVCTEYLPALKTEIMARDGKVVIRPDSGDPVQIICGDPDSHRLEAQKGVVELLWDVFGGTTTATGHKLLDSHIGAIYGDSITLARADEICARLKEKGFASQVLFGIGSYCVSGETPVLCADLVWRKAGELVVGQEIIAFDENPAFKDDKKAARCYHKATIKSNTPSKKNCLKVFTDVGDPITASDDHPWLVWVKNRSPKNTYISGGHIGKSGSRDFPRTAGLAWKKTSELKTGDQIAFFSKPWKTEETRSAGWLSGMFDGEGSVSRSTGDERIPAWKACISQNAGETMERLKLELRDRGFSFYENKRKCGQLVINGGWSETLRFLGIIRPERLLKKLAKITSNMPALKQGYTFKLATVRLIEPVGLHEVASIETSCGTFITGGYLSHNTYQYNTRDTFGTAMKATHVTIDEKDFEIFKSPVTDDGEKKSARGLLRVHAENGTYRLEDRVSFISEAQGELKTVFLDGKLTAETTLSQIRETLARHSNEKLTDSTPKT